MKLEGEGALIAALTAGSAVYLSGLILLALGVLWLPGLYQIDYDLGEFVRDAIVENAVVSMALTLVAAGIAAVAIGVHRWWASRRLAARRVAR